MCTGFICDSSSTSVEWKIPGYFQLSQRTDTLIESPKFHFLNASWGINLYPNGQRSTTSVEFVSLYLELLTSDSENDIPLEYSLGIKTCDQKIYHQYSRSDNFRLGYGNDTFGYSKFLERSQVWRDRNKITTDDGMLTIFCIANGKDYVTDATSQTVFCDFTALSLDFQNLFLSERKSDVTIKVKDQTFHAHKLILGTRSSVFAAMFEHGMKENSSGVVNIEDCDPVVFNEFLSYLYTGNVTTLSSKNVSQLFVLSDKYALSHLKDMCVHFMKNNLNIDIVCEVMAIADKHGEDDLRTAAKQLIICNLKSLIPTDQWILFMRENPLLASEILLEVIPD